MYQLEQTGKFKKDIKLAKKRGLDMRLLDENFKGKLREVLLKNKW